MSGWMPRAAEDSVDGRACTRGVCGEDTSRTVENRDVFAGAPMDGFTAFREVSSPQTPRSCDAIYCGLLLQPAQIRYAARPRRQEEPGFQHPQVREVRVAVA